MIFTLKGKPLDLSKYRIMHPMYDEECPTTVYKTGRQVSKTSTLAFASTSTCFNVNYYRSLYVAPLRTHAHRFSNINVKPLVEESPIVRQKIDTKSQKSVLMKSFTNGSVMHFGYCQNGISRIRGISCDQINYDEVQDLIAETLALVFECSAGSDFIRLRRFCGTPLTLENTLEFLWLGSSQNEPVVKCSKCNFENIPDTDHAFKMLSPDGPICYKCGSILGIDDILNFYWLPADPKNKDTAGYHVPSIFVPRNLLKRNWKVIWENYKKYSQAQFANEVLGLSWDLGARLVTLSELMGFCTLPPKKEVDKKQYQNICAGIDWGVSSITSFTVIVVLGYRHGKWELLYFYKFLGTDILEHLDQIVKILNFWKCDMVGADFGVGHMNCAQLTRRWCPRAPHRLSAYNYTSTKRMLKWNPEKPPHGNFSLSKVESLNNLFFEIKEGKFVFPKCDNIREYFNDILAEFEEISEGPFSTKKIFKHHPQIPDDFLHATNFAQITSKRMANILMIDDNKFVSEDEENYDGEE